MEDEGIIKERLENVKKNMYEQLNLLKKEILDSGCGNLQLHEPAAFPMAACRADPAKDKAARHKMAFRRLFGTGIYRKYTQKHAK
jgi:hypothetical protein